MSGDARTFELELEKEMAAKEAEARDFVVEVGQYLATQIVTRSPVDTGRFVANWNAAVGVPDVHTSANIDPGRESTIARLRSKVAEFKFFTGWPKIFFTEALPYANKLEHGSSNQAPQGIVSVSVQNTKAKFGGRVL